MTTVKNLTLLINVVKFTDHVRASQRAVAQTASRR